MHRRERFLRDLGLGTAQLRDRDAPRKCERLYLLCWEPEGEEKEEGPDQEPAASGRWATLPKPLAWGIRYGWIVCAGGLGRMGMRRDAAASGLAATASLLHIEGINHVSMK